MNEKSMLAYALIALLVGTGLWLTLRFLAKRRAIKHRLKGRGKQWPKP